MTTIDAWVTLMEHEPELCIRMLTVRYMMEQRGIHGPAIARHLRTSRQRVNQSLNPRHVRHAGQAPNAGQDATPETVHHALDRIERAITVLTRRRGGLDVAD